jgi:hypothetical protein
VVMPDLNRSFEILNILPDAPYEEAKAAYRELASILHPDKHMHNERLRIRAGEKFKQLLNAWNVLELYYKAKEERERVERECPEATYRAREELKFTTGNCPTCGSTYKVYSWLAIEKCRCSVCKWSLCAKIAKEEIERHRELERFKREEALAMERLRVNKEKFKNALMIYFVLYLLVIISLGGWGVVVTIITGVPLVLFTHLMYLGWSGTYLEQFK